MTTPRTKPGTGVASSSRGPEVIIHDEQEESVRMWQAPWVRCHDVPIRASDFKDGGRRLVKLSNFGQRPEFNHHLLIIETATYTSEKAFYSGRIMQHKDHRATTWVLQNIKKQNFNGVTPTEARNACEHIENGIDWKIEKVEIRGDPRHFRVFTALPRPRCASRLDPAIMRGFPLARGSMVPSRLACLACAWPL
jgi:hypothetical protein